MSSGNKLIQSIRMVELQTTANARENTEQWELSFTTGGNEKWCRHPGGWFGLFLKNYTCSYITQQLCSCVLTQRS